MKLKTKKKLNAKNKIIKNLENEKNEINKKTCGKSKRSKR